MNVVKALKVEGYRYILFCIIMLVLTFLGYMNSNIFILSTIGILLFNYILKKIGFDNEEYGNVYFHWGYIILVIVTVIIINVKVGWIG